MNGKMIMKSKKGYLLIITEEQMKKLKKDKKWIKPKPLSPPHSR